MLLKRVAWMLQQLQFHQNYIQIFTLKEDCKMKLKILLQTRCHISEATGNLETLSLIFRYQI